MHRYSWAARTSGLYSHKSLSAQSRQPDPQSGKRLGAYTPAELPAAETRLSRNTVHHRTRVPHAGCQVPGHGSQRKAGGLIVPGVNGLSDLAVRKDGTVFCLYERGIASGIANNPVGLYVARLNPK